MGVPAGIVKRIKRSSKVWSIVNPAKSFHPQAAGGFCFGPEIIILMVQHIRQSAFAMPTGICLNKSIAPFVPDAGNPWDTGRVRHLYRRIGFGVVPSMLESVLQSDPSTQVDQLVDEALARPLSPDPEWGNRTIFDYDTPNGRDFDLIFTHYFEWGYDLLIEMIGGGLREKMVCDRV